MSATAIEPRSQRNPWQALLWPLALISCGGLFGCAEEPLPRPKISREDCLRGLEMKQLQAAITRCDAVVAAFPADPFPLNERFLLHTLNQNPKAACRDIVRANALAKAPRAPAADAILRQDLKLRLASCQHRGVAAQPPSNR
ncbi:MAG: hypothetical protein ACK6AD_09775 [Cyanobacteriota bacterium]